MHKKQILALGFFDGVHIGHAALLDACRELAREQGCQAGAVTFDIHPEGLLKGTAPGLINTLSDREKLMKERFGMDNVIVLPFNRQMKQMEWIDFFQLLTDVYQAAGFVCGADFRFGFKGAGDAEKLATVCAQAGLPCRIVPQQSVDGTPVSSTLIRHYIETGHMHKAVKLLGHPYILTGKVVRGHQLGRTIGIPTANLMLPKELVVPKFGVYVCTAIVNGKRYGAVTNIGTRPTVAGIGITVEPWLLDYQGDLYGQELTLEFHQFLRSEKRFSTLEALRDEIHSNAEEARKILKELSLSPSCAGDENVVE